MLLLRNTRPTLFLIMKCCHDQAKIKELQEVVDFERAGRLRVSYSTLLTSYLVCQSIVVIVVFTF